MEQNFEELNRKIDALTAQVAYLAEQAQIAERGRQSREELLGDVMPIAREAMDLAGRQFEDVQEYLNPEDLIRLLKKLVRHGPQFELLLDQLDSLIELVEVFDPIVKEGVDKVTQIAGDLDRKGYIGFVRGGMQIVDNVVTSFSEEDVNKLGDNVVLILNTVKDMTQPEIIQFVRSTLLIAEEEVAKPVDISTFGLLRQMQDPSVRRGLALTLRVLHVIGAQAGGSGTNK